MVIMRTSSSLFSLARNCQYEPKKILTVFGEYYEGTIYLDIEKVGNHLKAFDTIKLT